MWLFRVRLYEIHSDYLILTNTVLLPSSSIRKEKVVYFRMFVFAISFTILAPFQAYAGTATQTDWAGGDGIWGPVIDWGSEFYMDTDIECYHAPSNIILQKTIALVPLKHTVDGDFNGPLSVYSADINGDGCMDVLGAAGGDGDITWWENLDGSGTSWTEYTVDGDFDGAWSVYSADVNGDGYMDILGAAMGLSDITWWENLDGSGTSWTEHIVDGDFNTACSVCAMDVNGDGYIDVIGAAYNGNDITWWENLDGSGTSWTEHLIEGNFFHAISVYSADINGDGFMDVLGAAHDGANITWWENVDGSGTSWTAHTVDSDFSGPYSVYSADVNGDGYIDVLGAADYCDDIAWWENIDGSGTSWIEHTVDGDFDGAYSVHGADINKDGYMDILGAADFAQEITWWENDDGSGTSWTEHIVDGGFTGARSVYSADVSGDGYLDVLGVSTTFSEVAWWDLNEYLTDGSLESSVLDVQESPDWQTLLWNCTEPSGTSVAFQVRASDNSSSMGAWSDTLTAPCTLEGILADEYNYVQYRAILTTTDSFSTPVLHDVTVGWQPFTGTQEGSAGEVAQFALYGAQPNPALGHASLVFALPVNSWAELTVYDLTGRVVHSVNGEYEPGLHEVILDGLASGMYMVRMTSEGCTATRQFVVIE